MVVRQKNNVVFGEWRFLKIWNRMHVPLIISNFESWTSDDARVIFERFYLWWKMKGKTTLVRTGDIQRHGCAIVIDPVVLQGHSRHECVNTRGHCTRDENIFMTRMVWRTIVLWWSLESDHNITRYPGLKNDQEENKWQKWGWCRRIPNTSAVQWGSLESEHGIKKLNGFEQGPRILGVRSRVVRGRGGKFR